MEHLLQYDRSAACFEEALPLGNGTLGAMVYGIPERERISLNHDTLWSGKPRHLRRPNAPEAYAESRRLLESGQISQAERLLEQEFTAPWSQSYLPLGNLYMDCRHAGGDDLESYHRALDLQNAVVTVRYRRGDVDFTRTCFVSHPDNCMVLRITSSAPADYTFTADSLLRSAVSVVNGSLELTGECPVSIAPEYARDSVPTVYDGTGMKFAACFSVRSNGHSDHTADTLVIAGATELTLIACIETSFIDFESLPTKSYLEPCRRWLEEVAAQPYETLYDRHVADYRALYDRIRADFGFPSSAEMTDRRLMAECKDKDLGLVELIYNYGRYLTIASSREGSQASNLQGIWNERLFAPWSSNYTLNINTEMNYWPVLMNNLAGLDNPIIELTKKLSVTGSRVARDYYNARGYCSHHNADLWGHASPVGMQSQGCLRYAFWNMSSGWLCRHLWEHYEYTLDLDYLRDTAWPLMRGAAEFYLDLLRWDGSHYIISPSTSPENSYMHPVHGRVSIDRSCAMTQGIVMDLFGNLDRAAKVLGLDDELIEKVRQILPHLNNYSIGSEGQLLEFAGDHTEHDLHHRHLSHLYGLYPGESITTESTPELARACRVTMERRGDLSTGWAMGWRVCLWAKLKDGDRALKLVKDQLRYVDPSDTKTSFGGGTYPNMLDAHPPFQIDGNFGVCAGITLMLLQCEDDKIRLLPALPAQFRNGSVRGLKAKGDITVDLHWQDGRLHSYSLTSPVDTAVTVVTPRGEQVLRLQAGIPKTICL